ncbi:hypothetical protein [Acidihalobacter prosperus]|uniref:Transcriptional regulator n=1 Tax=Acidihalobacter prosperus TaxID=160660 RepID=A0A1A6C8D4_9GAMM|nr:hypothetical protein [Acidihalobacter prosperus]OBS10816.1 hypothetical protein Thpro_020532 [Acidihalobacter prosperus]
MTDWIEVLREACADRGQRAVSTEIDYSTSVISQVLNGLYKGDLTRVQAAVEGALMGATVSCPVIGEMPRQRCIEYQRSPYAPTNPMRVQLFRTCPTCANNTEGKKS